jgi:hypothetical protein
MRHFNPLLLASFGMLVAAASCTLITDVDRSKIPDAVAGAPGHGGDGSVNPSGGDAGNTSVGGTSENPGGAGPGAGASNGGAGPGSGGGAGGGIGGSGGAPVENGGEGGTSGAADAGASGQSTTAGAGGA